MEGIGEVPPALLLPIGLLVLIDLIGRVTALIQCVRAERTRGPKVAWILGILLVGYVGWIAWFVMGRDEG